MKARNIYIVDDDHAVRTSLHYLLSMMPNITVRSFPTGDAFLKEAASLAPGCLLLDLHMPGLSGLELLKAIAPLKPRFVAVVLTGEGDVSVAVQAMKAGAVDFIEKPSDHIHLMKTIELALSHQAHSRLQVARQESAAAKLQTLSPRERDVLMGLIEGRSNKMIAFDLSISPRTVEIHRGKLMEKLEVRSLSEALGIAFAAGLFPPH
jgi:two-component system response regulator FixJ